jgi:hypothetical protein
MKRGVFILVLGLVAGAVGYCCIYLARTSAARALERTKEPELAWLKEEFHLSDAEFKRISELHAGYLPGCRKMCDEVAAQNARLETLLPSATNVTPEIQAVLTESARLRLECQRRMLEHFFQVSQTMPPEEGRRYLAWVKERALMHDDDMPMEHKR